MEVSHPDRPIHNNEPTISNNDNNKLDTPKTLDHQSELTDDEIEREDRNEKSQEKKSKRDKIDWASLVEEELEQNNRITSNEQLKTDQEPDNDDFMPGEPVTVKLTEVISTINPKIKLPDCIRGQYANDPFFKVILDKPGSFPNFEINDGLVFMKSNGDRLLGIPDIQIEGKKIRMFLIANAHIILAHLGPKKTLTYLRDSCWWKTIQEDVQKFCESCQKCLMNKPNNHQPYGLLQTLPVPSRPWESIGIDFMGPLPESKNRLGKFDTITVVIDHLTSMVHLIPSRSDYKAKVIAELVYENIYKLHGLPARIISDRDSYFTSTFWQTLHRLIGTELRMSSSYHPQTDGSTERANRTIGQMLRMCIDKEQKNWANQLPAIEFAINSARSETTGYAPFFLNYGRMPRTMLFNENSEYPGVKKFAQQIKNAIINAHDAIIATRVKQTRNANRKRIPAPFVENDLVYISTQNMSLPKGKARKLFPKFVGPYKINKDYGNDTFGIDLPAELKKRGLHSKFHASLLRLHIPNDDRRFPGRDFEKIDAFGKTEEWTVEKIVRHHGKGLSTNFEVLWKLGDKSWFTYTEIKHLTALEQYLDLLDVKDINKLPM